MFGFYQHSFTYFREVWKKSYQLNLKTNYISKILVNAWDLHRNYDWQRSNKNVSTFVYIYFYKSSRVRAESQERKTILHERLHLKQTIANSKSVGACGSVELITQILRLTLTLGRREVKFSFPFNMARYLYLQTITP